MGKRINSRSGTVKFSDDIAIKSLYDKYNAEKEFTILRDLYELYPSTKQEGWLYCTVKPLSFDKNGNIKMQRVCGEPLSSHILKNPNSAYHAGVWLALFHNTTQGDDGNVTRFSDYSTSHVIIDDKSKMVTAIDPGLGFGKRGLSESDLFSFIINVISHSLKNYRMPVSAIDAFLSGYYNTSVNLPEEKKMSQALTEVINKYNRRWSKASRVKLLISIPYKCYLNIYCRRMIKRILKQYS